MALKILNAGHDGRGVYLGGWNIAPDGYLIHHATSFEDAWETMIADMAEAGHLAPCDCASTCDCEESTNCTECSCEDCGIGSFNTDDVVMRVVRPTHRD